jgi:hypothetical protein
MKGFAEAIQFVSALKCDCGVEQMPRGRAVWNDGASRRLARDRTARRKMPPARETRTRHVSDQERDALGHRRRRHESFVVPLGELGDALRVGQGEAGLQTQPESQAIVRVFLPCRQ